MPISYESKTLSYSEDAKGWPSFYSFIPEYMVGMNSYFYSFWGGNLYRHNTNALRNNYYNYQFSSKITGVFNTEPQTIKLFKTMSFESDESWACTSLFTELGTGSMLSTYFEQKEREWFTFLRENTDTINFRARSSNGIGTSTSVSGPPTAIVITFPISIGSIISIGDFVFSVVASTPVYAGKVVNTDRTLNTITIDSTIVDPQGTAAIPPGATTYIVFTKSAQAESHGARGYFMQFTLENDSVNPVELFSVGSSVMKSYP
mgnify:CR=1 FL=1